MSGGLFDAPLVLEEQYALAITYTPRAALHPLTSITQLFKCAHDVRHS
jgi:hypothetical protein